MTNTELLKIKLLDTMGKKLSQSSLTAENSDAINNYWENMKWMLGKKKVMKDYAEDSF